MSKLMVDKKLLVTIFYELRRKEWAAEVVYRPTGQLLYKTPIYTRKRDAGKDAEHWIKENLAAST